MLRCRLLAPVAQLDRASASGAEGREFESLRAHQLEDHLPAYRVSTEIAAPPETVYSRVADLPRHGEWSNDPLEIQQVGDDEFTSTARSKGKTITATLRVVEKRPNERFAFEVEDLTGEWVNRFTISSTGKGTRVQREISGELSGAQLLLFWAVLYPVKKPNARRSLAKLKELIERGS
jgi:carbon monoxide dehydrogenase subunit G